jgi:hypothetical protein
MCLLQTHGKSGADPVEQEGKLKVCRMADCERLWVKAVNIFPNTCLDGYIRALIVITENFQGYCDGLQEKRQLIGIAVTVDG